MILNKIFDLYWLDEENQGHSEYFPNVESAEEFLKVLKEKFVVKSYTITQLKNESN